MNNSHYQAMLGISSHWLIEMLNSPAACYRKYLDPQRPAEESTNALRLGTLVHGLALTPRQFDQEFRVADYERRSKAGKARYAELTASGLTVIRPAELTKARAIVAALQADPDARQLLRGGKKERTIIQPRARGLLPLKARLDLHQESKRQIVELKTTYSLQAVATAIDRYRYPLSAAFYQELVKGLSVLFIFVQTTPPYEVAVLDLPRTQLRAGREQWQAALARFDTCWQNNDWPEGSPAALDRDDELMMMPAIIAARAPRRFNLPVGELAL